MALNPNIILGIQPPNLQQRDPLESYGKILGLKNAMAQGDLQNLQLQTAQRGFEDEEGTRNAYRDAAGDSTRLRALLGERGLYKPLRELDKFDLEKREKQSTIGKNESQGKKYDSDRQMQALERTGSILSTVKDPATYEQARRALAMSFGPQAIANMPEQYDPQFVQTQIAQGMTLTQRLADQRAREQIAETGRHNQATETNTRRGQDISAQTTREGHGVTIRGQNLTDSRAREKLNAGRWQNDMARGVQVNMATGETRPITVNGAPMAPKDDAPEAMLKAAGYADRMNKAAKILNTQSAAGKPGFIETAGQSSLIAPNMIANAARSPERQQYHQAAEDWVRAKLRQESGAVIADEEMNREIRTYFPQIGDSDAVIGQKKQARAVAEHAMKTAAGRANTPAAVSPEAGGGQDPLGLRRRASDDPLGLRGKPQ